MAMDASPLSSMSFEEALQELEQLVKRLESGREPLEQAIACFERGNLLKQHCETKLKEARLKVEKIMTDGQGKISTDNNKL